MKLFRNSNKKRIQKLAERNIANVKNLPNEAMELCADDKTKDLFLQLLDCVDFCRANKPMDEPITNKFIGIAVDKEKYGFDEFGVVVRM